MISAIVISSKEFSSLLPMALGNILRCWLTPSSSTSSDSLCWAMSSSTLPLAARENMDAYFTPYPSSPASSGAMCLRKKNFPFAAALRLCARCMLASTRLIGMYRFRSNVRITLVSSTMNTVNAEFSKSVSCISMLRNSVLQPMCGSFGLFRGGGGFHLTVCQFVLWMLSKCSVWVSSSTSSTAPSNMTSGSRMKRWATCCARAGSRPAPRSSWYFSSSMGRGMSLYMFTTRLFMPTLDVPFGITWPW
mmetsp:Transcript_5028/g.14659  ORF Transcript_5028/g.14659 Transcript_5028/m.14659 type:complete len:248 (-) Transcript_5028:1851-2594(-)